MCLLLTEIGNMSPLTVVGVALPSVVVDTIAAGVAIHEIIVLFNSI